MSPVGLCASCAHARLITSHRGSAFLLCEKSRTDPRYMKYPPLPVLRCPGHEPQHAEQGGRPASSDRTREP